MRSRIRVVGGAPPPPLDFAPQGVKIGHFSEGSRRVPGGQFARPPRIKDQVGLGADTHYPRSYAAPGGLRKGPGQGGPGGARSRRTGGGRRKATPLAGQGPPSPRPPGARLVSRVEVIWAATLDTAQMHPRRPSPPDQGSPRHPEAPDHHLDAQTFGPCLRRAASFAVRNHRRITVQAV